MLPYSKIYIDTKYRTADSVSSSDFKIELPETLTLPPSTKAYLTDITMVNTIKTIIKDYNDKIYWCKSFINIPADPINSTSASGVSQYTRATIRHRAWVNTCTLY